MTKQPVLTGFPHTVFATAKRRAQATIQSLRQQVIKQSLSGYCLLFERTLSGTFLENIDPTKRQRSYGHLPVFWAWLGQIFETNASCSKAVSMVQAWCRTLNLPAPTNDTSPYCQARKRLTDDFLAQVDAQVQSVLERHIAPEDRWRGHILKAIDGTKVTLDDTPKNQASYPQHSSQKEGCGFPIMGMVGMVNLTHGGVVGFETCGYHKHDARIAPRLLNTIDEGDILLGDRAFCSYEFIVRITTERKAHVVMRLHQARARKLDWRKGKKISSIERLVTWEKPKNIPVGSALTREQWAKIPDEITLRYIKLGYENRAGEKAALVIVTDLLDPQQYPAEEVADLYMERWEIEVKFRDLKTTMKMEHFAVKSPEMAHKTLRMMIIAYNLLQRVMQEAAHEAGAKINHMSVKGVLDRITSSHESFRAYRNTPRKRRDYYQRFIQDCAGCVLNIRPLRREPRAIKRRPKNHQMLTAHRHVFREVQHRSTAYRKPKKTA